MVVGVAVYNGRVAPRCVCADSLLLVTLRRGRVVEQRTVPVSVETPVLLTDLLRQHDVATFVCGSVHPDARAKLKDEEIVVIENVACSTGEAVAALARGTLRKEFGFDRLPGPDAPGAHARIDCVRCDDRRCLRGEACPQLAGEPSKKACPRTERVLEAASDISAETERRLCRLAELVYFCLELDYRTIGIAYCVDLSEPAEILADVLGRFFDVVPVCCRVRVEPCNEDAAAVPSRCACHPLLQAALLNRAHTDLNVLVGLCVGVDCIFTEASDAPVTTLFVKDRSLANNPVGAVYSEYHIRESVAPGKRPSARVPVPTSPSKSRDSRKEEP